MNYFPKISQVHVFFVLSIIVFEHAQAQSDQANQEWQKAINARSANLKDLYVEKPIKIFPNQAVMQGQDSIANHLLSTYPEIDSIYTKKFIPTHQREGVAYAYEIGGFQDPTGQLYKHLIIWRVEKDKRLRALELTAEATPDAEVELSEITARREEWMKWCNAHEVPKLVDELYASSPLYYNHRPLITGRDALVKEYGYMRNERYQLTLKPLIVETVHSQLAYEIGQCEGAYGGKYILIWQKDNAGQWKISLDANL